MCVGGGGGGGLIRRFAIIGIGASDSFSSWFRRLLTF